MLIAFSSAYSWNVIDHMEGKSSYTEYEYETNSINRNEIGYCIPQQTTHPEPGPDCFSFFSESSPSLTYRS